MVTGILLIVMERFNINKPHHQDRSLRLNNASVCLIFLTLVINVIVTSFAVDIKMPEIHHFQNQFGRSLDNITAKLNWSANREGVLFFLRIRLVKL